LLSSGFLTAAKQARYWIEVDGLWLGLRFGAAPFAGVMTFPAPAAVTCSKKWFCPFFSRVRSAA
jgi:hypothetical protein